jgi:ABC-type transport system involved in multi-copper enzyme maturation permease subunit
MNPMIGKELRQRMRERQGWILPSLYLAALGAVITLVYYEETMGRPFQKPQGWEIGVALFMTVAYTQLALLLLMAPIFSAGALTIEKEQRTLAGLLTTLLRPIQIWWGKFAASLMYVLLLLVAGLPVLSAVFAFGGVGPWEVGMAAFTTVVILATISAMSLYWSSVFRRSVHATAVSYVSVIVMAAVTFIIFSIGMSISRAPSWIAAPGAVRAPLYFNPFFFLTVAFVPADELYPAWVQCLAVFTLLGVLSVLLTLRNLRRGGELV